MNLTVPIHSRTPPNDLDGGGRRFGEQAALR